MRAHKPSQFRCGIVAIMALVMNPALAVQAGEPCASCGECEAKLASGLYATVELTVDIIDHPGVCIGLDFGESDVVFDCNGFLIDGDEGDTDPNSGISIRHGSGVTITNCTISDFENGIVVVDAVNITLKKNRVFSNRGGVELTNAESCLISENRIGGNSTGIKLSDARFSVLRSNHICGNFPWDIYFANGLENVGDGNTCETTYYWSEGESPGCSYECPFFADGFESGCCNGWEVVPPEGFPLPPNPLK